MKKILAFIICIVLVCAMPLVTFAETEDSIPADEESSVTENVPTEEEEVTEGENEGEEVTPEPTPEPEPTPTPAPTPTPTPEEQAKAITEQIATWLEENSGVITIVCTIIGYGAVIFNTIKKVIKSMTTMNNNAVSISEHSGKIANEALEGVKNVSDVVKAFDERMSALLDEVRSNAEEKKKLEKALTEVETHLKTAKLANMELANEVAELLVLANIPNSKKEELYSRHLAAVGAIADAEKTEVKDDDKEA